MNWNQTKLRAAARQCVTMDGTSLMLLLPAGHFHQDDHLRLHHQDEDHLRRHHYLHHIKGHRHLWQDFLQSAWLWSGDSTDGVGLWAGATNKTFSSQKCILSIRRFPDKSKEIIWKTIRQLQGTPLGWLTLLVKAQKLRWVNACIGFLTMIQSVLMSFVSNQF